MIMIKDYEYQEYYLKTHERRKSLLEYNYQGKIESEDWYLNMPQKKNENVILMKNDDGEYYQNIPKIKMENPKRYQGVPKMMDENNEYYKNILEIKTEDNKCINILETKIESRISNEKGNDYDNVANIHVYQNDAAICNENAEADQGLSQLSDNDNEYHQIPNEIEIYEGDGKAETGDNYLTYDEISVTFFHSVNLSDQNHPETTIQERNNVNADALPKERAHINLKVIIVFLMIIICLFAGFIIYSYWYNRKLTICFPDPCLHDGMCDYEDNKFTCTCRDGFFGKICQNTPCSLTICQNNGSCYFSGNTSICVCPVGYKGPTCNISVCENSPCSNNGSCEPLTHGFRCKCNSGYSGFTCEISPCHSSPCHNGATCLNTNNGFRCVCKENFSGTHCEVSSPCHSSPCPDGWICNAFTHACYLVVNEESSWDKSNDFCLNSSSCLAYISTTEEANWIGKLTKADTWVAGLRNNTEFIWDCKYHKDRQLVPLNSSLWAPNEPSFTANCIHLWKYRGFKLDDDLCILNKSFICKRGIADVSTR